MRGGLDASRLDRRVTIQRITSRAQDAYGGEVAVWSDLATVWAQVGPDQADEGWRNSDADLPQIAAITKIRVRIRWGLGVGPLDRLRYEGRDYEICRVDEIGRRVGQEIRAVARAE